MKRALDVLRLGLFSAMLAFVTLACCRTTNVIIEERNTVPWSFADIIESSVSVSIQTASGDVVSGGSGTLIPGGRVLTARHVVDGLGSKKIVVFSDFEFDRSPAVVLMTSSSEDAAEDWAILVLEKPFGTPANLPEMGDLLRPRYSRVWAVGYPLWSKCGIITEGRFQGKEYGLLRITAPIIYGNSGGGLFASARGKPVLIGMPVRIHLVGAAPVSHMAFCVDVQELVNRKIL